MAKPRHTQFGEGSLIHIIHRGTRGTEIVKDDSDRWHFLKALYFTNDRHAPTHWNQDLNLARSDLARTMFEDIRAKMNWEERETYVDILVYCLMFNHLHLFIYVKDPEDVGRFMQRLSTSLAMRFNKKFDTKGSLFESRYKVSDIKNDLHLNIVVPYIIYKNPSELFPGGIEKAINNPNEAFKFASNYDFCSLGDLLGKRPQSAILNTKRLYENIEIPKDPKEIKRWCIDYLKNRLKKESGELGTDLILE